MHTQNFPKAIISYPLIRAIWMMPKSKGIFKTLSQRERERAVLQKLLMAFSSTRTQLVNFLPLTSKIFRLACIFAGLTSTFREKHWNFSHIKISQWEKNYSQIVSGTWVEKYISSDFKWKLFYKNPFLHLNFLKNTTATLHLRKKGNNFCGLKFHVMFTREKLLPYVKFNYLCKKLSWFEKFSKTAVYKMLFL